MYECIIKKQKQLTSYPLFTQLPEVFWKALWKRKQARSLIKIYVNMLIIHLRVKKIMIIARRIANIAYSITCAKLCPTLWDPMDCSPPGLAHWNFPGKKNGVGCHFLLQWIFPIQGWQLSLLSPSLAGEFFITVPLETHQKRLWCWEGLRAGGEGDDRRWDGWMALLTWCTWVWVNSRSWWWSGRPGVLRFMESQRVGHDWMMELNWTERSPL